MFPTKVSYIKYGVYLSPSRGSKILGQSGIFPNAGPLWPGISPTHLPHQAVESIHFLINCWTSSFHFLQVSVGNNIHWEELFHSIFNTPLLVFVVNSPWVDLIYRKKSKIGREWGRRQPSFKSFRRSCDATSIFSSYHLMHLEVEWRA